jgi:hypothetical protein
MSMLGRASVFTFCLSLLGAAACNGDKSSMPTGPSPTDGVSIGIENEPCVASANGTLSCRFIVLPSPPDPAKTFSWRIEIPATGRAVQGGALGILPVSCEIAPGLARFDVVVKLIVYSYALDSTATISRPAVITRAPGACGT